METGDADDRAAVASSVLDRVTDGVVALDADLRYTYVNERAAAILGESAESLLGEYVFDAFPNAKGTVAEERITGALETQTECSFERHNPDVGKWFEVRVYPDDDGVSIYFTDVTERRDSEAELQRTNRQLTALIENTSQAIYIKNRDGEYELMNEAAADLFGIDPDAAVGRDDTDLFDAESAAAIREADREIVASGEPDTSETVRYVDGERHVFRDNKYPYRDEDGEVIGLMGVSPEVTERRKREEALRRKNKRLDEFASVVSHDLRNPLEIALGRAELLDRECDSDHVDHLLAALERMNAIVADTLTLAREGETVDETGPVALSAVVRDCWDTVDAPGADLTVEVAGSFTVRADRDRLRHVFENLFRNAVEHAEADSVRVGRLDDGFYVEDDGPGVPEPRRATVFEPGETTADSGTGFGLPIVKRVAEAHGWRVDLTEGSEGGASFEFTGVTVGGGPSRG